MMGALTQAKVGLKNHFTLLFLYPEPRISVLMALRLFFCGPELIWNGIFHICSVAPDFYQHVYKKYKNILKNQ